MPETHPITSPRAVGAPPYEPPPPLPLPPSPPLAVRLGTPALTGPGGSHPNHPVLLPDEDGDDDVALTPPPRPTPTTIVAPKPHGYRGLVRPLAYVASGVVGGLLVMVLYGMLGPRVASFGNRAGTDAAPGVTPITDPAVLDRRADTLALAISAFNMRAAMYDSRRMPCSGLQRGLTQVEDAWLGYNVARKDLMAGADPVRDARDRSLYADVRSVEARFERSSCTRP